MNQTIYRGTRGSSRPKVWRIEPDKPPVLLNMGPSLALHNHAPTGFSWGYEGSGPAQLALALLLDACGRGDKALAYYQRFKHDEVAWFQDNWEMSEAAILTWVQEQVIVDAGHHADAEERIQKP